MTVVSSCQRTSSVINAPLQLLHTHSLPDFVPSTECKVLSVITKQCFFLPILYRLRHWQGRQKQKQHQMQYQGKESDQGKCRIDSKKLWSCECKKVVTDILAKLSFQFIWKIQVKHTIQDLVQVLSQSYFYFYEWNRLKKTTTTKIEMFLPKASVKQPKRRYDFVAFT